MTTASFVRALTFMIMVIAIGFVMVLFLDIERKYAIAMVYNQLAGAVLWTLWLRVIQD